MRPISLSALCELLKILSIIPAIVSRKSLQRAIYHVSLISKTVSFPDILEMQQFPQVKEALHKHVQAFPLICFIIYLSIHPFIHFIIDHGLVGNI